MQPESLPLRDIHLPTPVSWWPLADGWWLCIALLVLAGVALAWWWRGTPSRRARHAALAELAEIESHYARQGDGLACAQGVSRLLRRLALLAGDTRAAHSRGDALPEGLASLSKTPVPIKVVELVREAPYSPAAAAAIDAQLYGQAIAQLRAWLSGLRVPRKVIANARHVAV